MNKKIFVFLILLLVVSFSTQAFASLTFTTNSIMGTTASSIDLGSGNALSLNTTNNAPIITGTGLTTLGGGLNVVGDVGIGMTESYGKLSIKYTQGDSGLYIEGGGSSSFNNAIYVNPYGQTNNYGLNSNPFSSAGQNGYGVYSNPGGSGTNYSFYGYPNGSGTDWGIYITGEDKNYFSGNVGIGTSTPGASSILDISSTTKGVVLPRMTKVQRDAIATPVAGMAVYQTDNTPGLRVYNGTNWMKYTETID